MEGVITQSERPCYSDASCPILRMTFACENDLRCIATTTFFRRKSVVVAEHYVGNLSFEATEGDIRQVFCRYGDVSSVKILRETGRSCGFVFVEMPNDKDASRAIEPVCQGRGVRAPGCVVAKPHEGFSGPQIPMRESPELISPGVRFGDT
jgi:hypothetical protein